MSHDNIQDIYPLSPTQQGMLFHSLYAPGSGVYCEQLSCSLHGRLDMAAFVRAWAELMDRHEVLRTAFFWEEMEEPVQVVLQDLPLPLQEEDWREVAAAELPERLEGRRQEERQAGFDLARAPLMRLSLVRTAAEVHELIWTFHHLLLDGWSVPILLQELFTLYEAFHQGQELRLERPRPYREFIAWQRQQEQPGAEGFWRELLRGFTAPTPLRVERLSGIPPAEGFAEQRGSLAASATAALQSLARQHQLTLNTIVQGAWAMLLSRYSGEEDVLFGATLSGRPGELPGADTMVGLFINTLPVRVRVGPDEALLPWLKGLQGLQADLHQHQQSPLPQIQAWSEVPRGTPLFESILVFENYPMDANLQQKGVSVGVRSVRFTDQTNYPLTLVVVPGTELAFRVVYDRSRFDEGSIARLLGHLQRVLESIAADQEQRLSQVELLTQPERQQLLVDWAATRSFPAEPCLHQLFEAQVRRSPEAVAVTCEDRQVTYRELNQQANQLARHLRRQGVGPQSLVGIFMDRSVEMVVAILGILKAGGAYLPVDLDYPPERVAFMLEDAGVAVLLTQESVLSRLPDLQARIIRMDGDWERIALEGVEEPEPVGSPDQLAYVIYTSGSTGKPKGCLVTHANVVRLMTATDPWYHFDQADVWTLFHSYAFDFSVWEIWGALLYGGRLVVVPYFVSRSPEAFYDLLVRERVTVLNQTPSAFRQLMRAEESVGVAPDLALRLVIFGGEALELQSLRPWYDRHGDERPLLVNMYGITETTVHVTYRPLCAADLEKAPGSVIGRPIPDLQIYVLDQHLQPVPIGVPGEMYVCGAGLARGYLNRPELTAQRFVQNPFAEGRLYKTGDLARYLPDGDLEYLGRIDNQVKIRGFRIELGEIESALCSHPDVREAVVLAREDGRGEHQGSGSTLVAYVVPRQPSAVTPGDLRLHLRGGLPEYMLPAAFVMLDALPLTTNGKVDRKALPAPDQGRPDLEREYVAPRNPVEQELAAIWQQVLGVDRVGIDDGYFDLGGDSIRSIQVQARARERGLHFTVQQLFKLQSIRALAAVVEAEGDAPESAPESAPFSLIAEADRLKLPPDVEDAYPLTMLQMGMLFHTAFDAETPAYINVSSFHLQAPFDPAAWEEAMGRLLEAHPILRTSFDLDRYSEPLQLVHRSVAVPLQIEDLRHLPPAAQEERLSAWLREEQRRRFDWTEAPLLRFHVHRRSDDRFQFTLTEHHAILDGWSVASMLTELFQRYLALPVEPPPAASFRDYVALEREALSEGEAQAYWRQKLQDATVSTLAQLPVPAAEAGESPEMRSLDVAIAPEVSTGLLALAHTASVPISSVLLSAHLRVIALLSGQTDVMTGLVTNVRPEMADGERVLGLFLNTLPVRVSLAGGTWVDLARQTFAAEQEMLPHRRYPMAQVQREHGQEPLFTAAFNYTHFHVFRNVQHLEGIAVIESSGMAPTNFPLFIDFSMDPSADQVQLSLTWNTAEFGLGQVEAIGGYFARILEAMASTPTARYERLSPLADAERRHLLEALNETRVDYPADRCIHHLFEAQVERTPEATAVAAESGSLTFRELNRQANRLAHALQGLGIGPDSLVGVCMDRSPAMVVALLAILKAGGAYVPLDPSYPPDRIAFMLSDSAVPVLLSQNHLRPTLPDHPAHLIALDPGWEEPFSDLPTHNPAAPVSPSHLAYVIYTSGSTGLPKGVAIEHRATAAFLHWARDQFGPADRAGVLASTSICFDLSVFELFVPLCWGGTVILADNALHLLTHSLAQQVSLINTVPSAIAELLRAGAIPHSVRTINLAGEPLPGPLVQRLYQQTRAQFVYNLYGPSEDTTYSTFALIDRHETGKPSIGRPIANTQVYLLDPFRRPVPMGVVGELYLGGHGLARGYLGRPDLTAERFIPNPFRPGARLYRTGDLARYRPDGAIDFLGRNDQQVKIRGFRIELGEIEAVLGRHPAVRESVVMAREDESGEQRLVAYLVPARPDALTSTELRAYLRERLPDYMIPALFLFLPALPLTPNGKVDRKALPAPSGLRPDLETSYEPPRTELERQIAQIWQEALGLARVGVNDNFFELGGHSLLAVKVHSRLRLLLERDLPMLDLFQYPTVGLLAGHLSRQQGEEPSFDPELERARKQREAMQRRRSAKARQMRE